VTASSVSPVAAVVMHGAHIPQHAAGAASLQRERNGASLNSQSVSTATSLRALAAPDREGTDWEALRGGQAAWIVPAADTGSGRLSPSAAISSA
jgi:hypothetical protein